MNARWGVRQALLGLLFIIGALPLAAPAEPIVRDRLRDLSREEGIAGTDQGDSLSIVGDVVQEVRRTGPGVSPSLIGIDDGFLANGGLLHSEVRPLEAFPVPVRAVNTRGFDSGGPDLFRETIDGALRATRDAFFDSADTASFSVAGIDLNVTLRGERRGVSVNGVDLLGSNQTVAQLNEWSGSSAIVPQTPNIATDVTAPVRQVSAEDGLLNMANIRRLVFHPTTIIAAIVLVGFWVVVVVADVSRSRRS